MQAKQKFGKSRNITAAFLLALVLSMLVPVATPQSVHAEQVELGYLWKLYFDFGSNFDGLLTIEVGPWVDGELAKVYETSTARVRCNPVGAVGLGGGSAIFTGGHLECSMDLGAIVLNNHGLAINAVDTYGSIIAYTKINSAAPTVAPIFTHPNAAYSIDFTQTSALTQNQLLWNGVGVMQTTFNVATLNTWQAHSLHYICIFGGGPCDARFGVAGLTQVVATAGQPVQFSTGPTSFQVGGAAFTGQMDALLIDPGNSAH